MLFRTAVLLAFTALSVSAQKYAGPRPAKPDIPYLLHAASLLETEVSEAQQSKVKDDVLYTVKGAGSDARTPLAEPIFILDSQKLNPDQLSLYKMEVKNGQRQLLIPTQGRRAKNAPKPIFLMVNRLAGSLYKVEVNEYLENGEYCLSPDGSNQVFCFATY